MSDDEFVAFGPDDAGRLAPVHAAAFAAAWDEAALRDLLSQPETFALGRPTEGFILCRVIADEAEILTLATTPSVRRRGLGLLLVEAAAQSAAGRGADRLFLEVAEDNLPARTLYARAGFGEVGRRRNYYARSGAAAVDALVLALNLS